MATRKEYRWRLGEILVQNGWITWDQLEEALEIQKQAEADPLLGDLIVERGLIPPNEGQALNLGEILIKNAWITWPQLQKGLEVQRQSGRKIGEILVEMGFVSSKTLHQALAIHFGKAFVDFEKITIPKEVIQLIPKWLAFKYRAIPLLKKNGIFLIAVSDPQNAWFESELRPFVPDYEIRTAIGCPTEIHQALIRYYGPE